MKAIHKIVFRNLTNADFFNINKPRGSELGGGGQGYIDFPVRAISVASWINFFNGISDLKKNKVTQGPSWEFPVHSIGVTVGGEPKQSLTISQRRAASISITRQKLKIHSIRANRVFAWDPVNGFPKPFDNSDRNQCPEGLIVFLVSTFEGEVWAGWYLNDGTSPLPVNNTTNYDLIAEMLPSGMVNEGYSGMLEFENGQLNLDETNKATPFILLGTGDDDTADEVDPTAIIELPTEEEEIDKLFDEDIINQKPEVIKATINIRKRNAKIVKILKELYEHKCQITGDEYVFKKKNGINYTEAHHLIPLGKGGSDRPENLVILSPLVHKMLHYADVGNIDLDSVVHLDDGSATLDIVINEKTYSLKWQPRHAELFKDD